VSEDQNEYRMSAKYKDMVRASFALNIEMRALLETIFEIQTAMYAKQLDVNVETLLVSTRKMYEKNLDSQIAVLIGLYPSISPSCFEKNKSSDER
jgi:nitrogen fixation/metabolism regulation signal transduction histidine kinase